MFTAVDRIVFWFISNLCRVLNIVVALLGDFPASEFYVQTFRNTAYSILIGDVSRKNCIVVDLVRI
jgi:hypothetical protein